MDAAQLKDNSAGSPLRLLVLSFYYPPDLSAGSFRAAALVSQLQRLAPSGSTVRVLTTAPNRYATHQAAATVLEERDGLRIDRIPVPVHRSGFVDQARTFLAYAREVRRRTARQDYDLVFGTSSRLMTASLAADVARRCGAPLYLDIRDIFVETIQDILPRAAAGVLPPLFRLVEQATFRRANRINLVSEGFRSYFEDRFPGIRYDFFTNGIDDEFLAESWESQGGRSSGPIRVLYAGNIGEGQGLHRIVPGLAKALGDRYELCILGDGGRRAALEQALASEGVTNVLIRKPVPRSELIGLYRDADVLFLHLNDHDAFRRVLPSKIFEYAATGRSVLAGVAGHAAQFLRENVRNCCVFPPCDVGSAVEGVSSLALGWTDRSEFIRTHRRSEIMQRMARSAIELASLRTAASSKQASREVTT